ncbi:MAG: aldehyde dehydrogenase EutE [Deltaproteobacteria bacterium]|nr:aldehyde dehydrogenase EutE [Deltaproteobacteria bacterium]
MPVPIDEGQLARIVEDVVRKMRATGPFDSPVAAPDAASGSLRAPSATDAEGGGIFATVDEAVKAAREAYGEFSLVSLERRKGFIEAMRKAAVDAAERLGRDAVAETGLGRVPHKIQKILLAATKTPGVEDLEPHVYTGDNGLTLVEPAPWGVVGSITPTTNPAETIVNNALSAVSAGNAVVFHPHPSAKGVSNLAVRTLNRAIHGAGGPRTLLCSIASPTLETSAALMQHPGIRILVVTGGGEVVRLAMRSGKKCIAAGPGNPPVIVDDTADLAKAARSIVDGASFDNNVLCTAEKEVLVFEHVADRLISEMQSCGALLVAGAALERLLAQVVVPGEPFPHPHGDYPHPNKAFVGKDASVLLAAAGLQASRDVRLLIAEVPFEHPLVQGEMLMPLLPIVRVKDLDDALAKALVAEHGYRHSAVMHSESVSRLTRVAREIETTIFTKNAPSYAGLGYGGEGYCTLSIAGPTGEGLTSARSFTRQRRCVLVGGFRIL